MTIENRAVRYQSLIPCTSAFIDTKSPGSDKKENFTIIGPGVAENPEQHVHISIPHGFNIGGARQPAGCLNSQHSHLTEEVFVVHSGVWRFMSGVNADDGEITLAAGDVISIPTDIFRGFECIEGIQEGERDNLGYLHAVLGGDDPGRVLWSPSVFEMAKEYGLVLLEDGSLIDKTKGESIPKGKHPMPVTTQPQIDSHRIVTSNELNSIVLRCSEFVWQNDTALAKFTGVEEAALIGGESKHEHISASKLDWSHGFVMRGLKLQSNASIPHHIRLEEEVVFVHKGSVEITVDGESIQLSEGDNFTTPIGSVRGFENKHDTEAILYVTRGGNSPSTPQFI
jgi:quercetin dioxygenase-like cupin family protein